MEDQVVRVTYFGEPGPHNTDLTLTAALERAKSLELKHVVVATDSGKTATKVLDAFGNEFNVVAVTNSEKLRLPITKLHDYTERFRNFREDLASQGIKAISVGMTDEAMTEMRGRGVKVSRIDWKRFNAFVRQDVNCMDRIGVPLRVAVTCVVWAYVNGDLPPDVDVVSLAGTGFGGGGADTAVLVRTARSWGKFRVLETLARPRESPPSMMST